MTHETGALSEARLVQQVADEYRGKGYDVVLEPGADQLPTVLAPYRPDIIARRDDETIVIEVKSRHSLRRPPQLEALAKAVRELPGWRFELIVAKPDIAFPLPETTEPWDEHQVGDALDEAGQLLRTGHPAAALLLAWAATEAALRLLASKEGLRIDGWEANALLNNLTTSGVLTRGRFKTLRDALEVRNAVAHGLMPPKLEPSKVQKLIQMTADLLGLAPAD